MRLLSIQIAFAHALCWTFVLASGLGCATTRIENQPLTKYVRGEGYGARVADAQGGKLRVVLAFSGGGTRAAALAYGVLEALRTTEVEVDGDRRRLLDHVTAISSVSGGSFTAAYYGLHGDGIFDDFEDRFLLKDIDARLALSLLRPIEALRIMLTSYTRSDMAMDVYDDQVFGGATFADLAQSGGPALNINATDIDVGAVFTFVQPSFDMICSDLSKMKVVQAVTASSAVPGIFSPILLENHAGTCGYPEPAWISEALANPLESRRRTHEARTAITYLDRKKRPYIFLVDGGVADNIGARRILEDVIDAGGALELARSDEMALPEHIIFILVNAQADKKHGWAMHGSLPSIFEVLDSVTGTGIYRYNFETVELLRESAIEWSRVAKAHGIPLETYVAEVAFDNLSNPKDRDFFNDIGTNFHLRKETVDRLIEVGGELLRESPDFRRLLSQLETKRRSEVTPADDQRTPQASREGTAGAGTAEAGEAKGGTAE